ncbi:MAG: PKD domain-containing protein, partial [Chitinophagales bacterium]|nr:PKD domain-containing protein [Chitinophagales bacterium]
MKHTNTTFFNTLFIALLAIMLLNGCKKEDSTTCTDGAKNGTETGVDCGGDCNACAPPIACFTANNTSAHIGQEFIFTNCSTGGTSSAWDFGDGNTSTQPSPRHRYLQTGNYTVTLSVTNADTTTTKTMAINILLSTATYAGNYHVTS